MAGKSLDERVDMLGRRTEILEQLPERVTAAMKRRGGSCEFFTKRSSSA
jgi:hypothetical protein